jgi:hypothetical protein
MGSAEDADMTPPRGLYSLWRRLYSTVHKRKGMREIFSTLADQQVIRNSSKPRRHKGFKRVTPMS